MAFVFPPGVVPGRVPVEEEVDVVDEEDYDEDDEEEEEEDYADHRNRACNCSRCLRSAGPAREASSRRIEAITDILYDCDMATDDDDGEGRHVSMSEALWLAVEEKNVS